VFQKNLKYLMTFLLIKVQSKIRIFEEPLKNGSNNMCHMLILVESKKNYFLKVFRRYF